MIFFPKNKFLDAAVKTILLFATLHILVLLVAFLQTGDPSLLNIGRILEINRMFLMDIAGSMGNTISLLVVALVYGIVYFRFTK